MENTLTFYPSIRRFNKNNKQVQSDFHQININLSSFRSLMVAQVLPIGGRCHFHQAPHHQYHEQDDVDWRDCDESVELGQIALSNAFGNPGAVVVVALDTDVTVSAVVSIAGFLSPTLLTDSVSIFLSHLDY